MIQLLQQQKKNMNQSHIMQHLEILSLMINLQDVFILIILIIIIIIIILIVYTVVKKTFLNITIKLNKSYPNIRVNDVKVKIHDEKLIDITIRDEIVVKDEETFGPLNEESTVISIDGNTSQVILFFKLKQRGMWSCFFRNEAININSVRVFDTQEKYIFTYIYIYLLL